MLSKRRVGALAPSLALLLLAAGAFAQATLTSGLGLSTVTDKVRELEARTQAAEAALKQTSKAFREAWERLDAMPLTAGQARLAHEGKLEALPPAMREALVAAKPLVAAHQAALTAYFEAYDQLSVTRMDQKVMEVIQELESTRQALAQKHGEDSVWKLRKPIAELRAAASKYWDARQITQGRDSFKRIYGLNDLSEAHRKAQVALRRVQQKLGEVPTPTFKERVASLDLRLRRAAANLRLKASMAPKVGRLLAYLARPFKKPDPDRMSDVLKELGATYTTRGKVKITTVGRERVPQGKKLIFTPSHRQGMIDSMIMVQMMPGNFTPLMTFRYYPEYAKPVVKKLLEGEPGLIPVDLPGIDVVEKAVQSVKDGRALLIYPEGHVASPLGELRPLRFGIEKICEMLLDEDVALVPVSLDDPADRWAQRDYGTGDRELGIDVRVVFDKPINPRVVYAMSQQLDGLLLDLIRETWHRNIRPALAPAAVPAQAPEQLEGQADYREPLFEAVHEN